MTRNNKVQTFGHVGFLLNDNGNTITLLGGNQGIKGEVRIRDFQKRVAIINS